MFKDFLDFFDENITYEESHEPVETFLRYLGGKQFRNGLFNSFTTRNINKWNQIVEEAFPEFSEQFKLFGYDWLGRCFGIDLREETRNDILMFEIGTNDVLEIPTSFCDFLNQKIPLYTDACLSLSFYHMWLEKGNELVKYERCVGYKIPLFLGGKNEIENMEDSDMEVYWYISSI